MIDQLLQPQVLLTLAALALVAAAYVRFAWWVAQRFGTGRLVLAWLGATVFRAHDVRATRRVVDMVASIRGDRAPLLAERGVAR